jgi:hypothetical protein
MKTLNIFLAFLVPSFSSLAKNSNKEFEKTWVGSYTASDFQNIEISNKYGKILVTTGDQKNIEVKVLIHVNLSSESSAQKMLDKIEIIERINGGTLSIQTSLNNMNKVNNADLNIDYTVSIPKSINTKLTNAFGDIYINDLSGNADFTLSYGSLKSGQLLGASSKIDLSFGNADLDELRTGEIELSYSNLELNHSAKIKIESSFSNLDIDAADQLELKSAYDNLDLDLVGVLNLKSSFSNIEIGSVTNSLKADVSYGGFEIDQIESSFTNVEIDAEAGEVEVEVANGVSYSFHCLVTMGSLEVPSNSKLTQSEKEMMSIEKAGTVGSNPGNRRIDIKLSQGNLELD